MVADWMAAQGVTPIAVESESVASEVMGVSARAMIQALRAGEKGQAPMADLARPSLPGKIPELQKARAGHLTEHPRFRLRRLSKELTQPEALLAELEAKIEERTRRFAPEIKPLDAVPGMDRRVAQGGAGGIGSKPEPISNPGAPVGPGGNVYGNEESAWKRRKRRIRQGNRWLKPTLVQAAWTATHTKNSYLPLALPT